MKRLLTILIYFHITTSFQLTLREKSSLPGIPQQVWSLTEVMFHDVVNPPAAARFYAYSLLSGYEVYCRLDNHAARFQDKLKNYTVFIKAVHDVQTGKIDKQFASLYAILETGKVILPSGYLLEEKQRQLVNDFSKQVPDNESILSSIYFAEEVSKEIVAYAKADGYFQLSIKPRYKPERNKKSWEPTPPDYMPAIEPHWKMIRTLLLDSASQFKPAIPVRFNTDSSSAFMKLAKEVYDAVNISTKEQKEIANFWDCNPFAVQTQGHMSIGLKKISPGGHWMGITGIASEKADLDFEHSLLLHTLVAITLHDAFISCWDEKYRSDRIRPETVINRYIDSRWKPLLQTPPFPEYSSGHSVISTATAEVLSTLLGEAFSFVDTTENYIGLPSREFNSFHDAAAEARISRLYGGIHFRDAIEEGGKQGRAVGQWVIEKLKLSPIVKQD